MRLSRSQHQSPRRPAVLAGLATALLLGVSACGGADEPADDPGPSGSTSATDAVPEGEAPEATPTAEAAAAWLADQLDDGVVRNTDLDFVDYGLTVDVALALDQVGGQDQAVAAATDTIRTDQAAYTTLDGDVFAGATAKALALLQSQDADPGDLTAQLEGLVGEGGRLADDVGGDSEDFANVVAQAYGARALADAGSQDAPAVAAYLLDQQCADGWFRAELAPAGAEDPTCDGDPQAQPDNDTTALVLLTLAPVAGEVRGGDAALEAAAGWLVSQQDDDGAIAGTAASEAPGPNANTTGLAGWALGLWGETDAAAAAAGAVGALQVAEGPDAGAIAYDQAALDGLDGREIDAAGEDQFRRATAQAAPALLWGPAD